MIISQDSWHYKIYAKVNQEFNGFVPERTDLCEYFWTVVGTLPLAWICLTLLGIFYVMLGLMFVLKYTALILSFILGLKTEFILSRIIGLKTEEISRNSMLRHFSLNGFKIYPFLVWMFLAITGILSYATINYGIYGLVAVIFGIPAIIGLYLLIRYINERDRRRRQEQEASEDPRVYYSAEPYVYHPAEKDKPASVWQILEAYFKAKKEKVCPIVTFKEKLINVKN